MIAAPCLPDDTLARLLDETLPEGEARAARTHLEACAPCRARAEALEGVIAALRRLPAPSPARTAAIVERATRARSSPRAPGRTALLAAPIAALLLAGVFVALPRAPEELQARGALDEAARPPEVHLLLHAVLSPDGQQSARLADGDVIDAGIALSATLQALPGERGRHAAVLARDAKGRVTWLSPAWLTADDSPRCVRVPDGPALLGPAPAVVLEDLPAGALEVAVLVFDHPCDLPAIDAALERGARLSPGALAGLTEVEHLTLFVRGES